MQALCLTAIRDNKHLISVALTALKLDSGAASADRALIFGESALAVYERILSLFDEKCTEKSSTD